VVMQHKTQRPVQFEIAPIETRPLTRHNSFRPRRPTLRCGGPPSRFARLRCPA
jgi:hypothetical protein